MVRVAKNAVSADEIALLEGPATLDGWRGADCAEASGVGPVRAPGADPGGFSLL